MSATRIACCLFLACVAGLRAEPTTNRSVYISVPTPFQDLERPPVRFDHDKHTAALAPAGCEQCHPKDEKGAFVFTFPKVQDERNAKAWMNSLHDACMGCHQERIAQKQQKAGPVTCGECHRAEKEAHRKEYVPVLPEYYDALRDTYHKECLACHREPAKTAQDAKALSWQSFYVKEQQRAEATWPKTGFDYLVHDKHEKALEKKCELCHYISPARQQQLDAEGKKPTCKDWLWELDETNSLTDRKAAHHRCINCHLTRKTADQKAGPTDCAACHSGKERPLEELANVPRSACEQKDKMLIELKEGARAKAVPFNHKTHESYTRSCQDCHHKTLRACSDCHTPTGSKDGGGVTLAEAYHHPTSPWSCIGCHETVKQRPTCAGCHDRRERGLVASACNTCHTGTLQSLDTVPKLPAPKELLPDGTKDEIEIAGLEKEYKPSKLPHLAIANKLTEISNESPLARYFHRDQMTICAGCHHRSPLEKQVKTPQCRTCHPIQMQPGNATPTLLGAYHQQCLGCHKQMVQTAKKLPQSCTGCHAEKTNVQ